MRLLKVDNEDIAEQVNWGNAYTFLGNEDDGGLSFFNARYYSPELGRFLSCDPIKLMGSTLSINPYVYSYNNPISYSDASGLAAQDNPGKGYGRGFADSLGENSMHWGTSLERGGAYEFQPPSNQGANMPVSAVVEDHVTPVVYTTKTVMRTMSAKDNPAPNDRIVSGYEGGATAKTGGYKSPVKTPDFVEKFLNQDITRFSFGAEFIAGTKEIVGVDFSDPDSVSFDIWSDSQIREFKNWNLTVPSIYLEGQYGPCDGTPLGVSCFYNGLYLYPTGGRSHTYSLDAIDVVVIGIEAIRGAIAGSAVGGGGTVSGAIGGALSGAVSGGLIPVPSIPVEVVGMGLENLYNSIVGGSAPKTNYGGGPIYPMSYYKMTDNGHLLRITFGIRFEPLQ